MKKMVAFLCFMMIAALLSAETAPDTLWTRTFGGDGYEKGYSVQQTSDGGYIMAGRTNSYGSGNYDAWLVKTDGNGEVEWTQTYGDSYIDEVYVVRQTSGGEYIAGGTSTAFGGAGKGWLIRTDSTGNELWQYGYRADGSTSSYWNYIYDIVETDDGDFVAAGFTTMDTYSYQGWIIKVDADGDLLWNKNYGSTYWERLTEIESTGDGNFIVAGDKHILYDTVYNHDGWLMKINADGDSLWAYTYGGEEIDLFRALCINNDGTIIAGGETSSYSSKKWAESEAWLVKTDSDGNEIWNKTVGAENSIAMVQCLENNYIIAGGGRETENDANDGLILKTDGGGNIIWEKSIFASSADDMISSLQQTSDGGYILGGRTNSWATGEGDLWLVKLEAEVTALTSFTEDFDEITTPALPDNWTSCMDVLLANTIADVYTTSHGSAPSSPNATLIMNGLDGSNGQLDSTAFVSLVTPLVEVGDNGSTLTFCALGGNPIIVGMMSDPTDTTTFTPIEEIALDYSFAEYSVSITSPGTTYLAFKHGNTSTCATIFVDDVSFGPQVSIDEDEDIDIEQNILTNYPNPVIGSTAIKYSCKGLLPSESVEIKIYNILGQLVEVVEGRDGTATWNSDNHSTGIYFYRIETESISEIRKMIVIK